MIFRSKTRLLALAVASSAVFATPAIAVGQNWVCIPAVAPAAASCSITTSADNTLHPFALKFERSPNTPGSRIPVRVVTTSTVVIPNRDSIAGGHSWYSTDSNGMLAGYLVGPNATAENASFVAYAEGMVKEVKLNFRRALQAKLDPAPGRYYFYTGSQLRDVTVWAPIAEADVCRQTVVRFAPKLGSVTMDSVYGLPAKNRCDFVTNWRLGDQVGRQNLQVTLASGTPVVIEAVARRKPSLRIALAGANRKEGVFRLSSKETKFAVERPLADGSLVKYDSTFRAAPKVDEAAGGWEAIPFVVFDTPIRPRYEWARLAVGASLTNFKRDFFVGASLLQIPWGIQTEDVGIDIQFGALLSNERGALRTPTSCELNLGAVKETKDQACAEHNDFRLGGWALTFSTDAKDLLSAASKMLGFTP